MKILAYVNTYGRTATTLPLTILSILNQTHKPDALVIYDENKELLDPLKNETLKYLLDLLMEKGIQWYWNAGERKGAHFNHENANMNTLGFEYAWFLDDDQVAEPTCLEELVKEMTPDVGAVGGLILNTPTKQKPPYVNGKLDDVWIGENIAWYKWEGKPKEVEHLYSSFLYRCNIVHHDLRLSKKVFRGETMFTHSFYLKGYKLICTPKSVIYHFEGTGGCRTPEQEVSNQEMYNHDNFLFQEWLKFKKTGKKLYVLSGGLGDHYMFKQAIPMDKEATYAVCYPDLFKGYNVISIAQAEQMVDRKDYDVYSWATKNNFKGHFIEAIRILYNNLNKHI